MNLRDLFVNLGDGVPGWGTLLLGRCGFFRPEQPQLFEFILVALDRGLWLLYRI